MVNGRVKYFRDIFSTIKKVKTFLEPGEPIPKRSISTYVVADIPYPWNEVTKALVKLSTLKGRHLEISDFHFLLLAHFIGKMQVNLPYFLFHSMGFFICRNRGRMPLH